MPLLFLAIGSLQFQTVSPAVSKDADYKAVFNENLPWPDSESALQYSSARKFALVGERQQAAANLASVSRKLERRLQASQLAFGTWAQLQVTLAYRPPPSLMLRGAQQAMPKPNASVSSIILFSTAEETEPPRLVLPACRLLFLHVKLSCFFANR